MKAYFGFVLLSFIAMGSCQQVLDWVYPLRGPAPCDPSVSVHRRNERFFERKFTDKENATYHHREWWLKASHPENSPCDPLHKKQGK